MNSGKDTLYFGAGTDDPKNSNLLPGTTRAKNSFLWASYFRKITNDVTAAFEWSYWDFQNVAFPDHDPTRGGQRRRRAPRMYSTFRWRTSSSGSRSAVSIAIQPAAIVFGGPI